MGLRSFTALDFYLLFIVVLHLYPKFSSVLLNIERKSSLTEKSKLKYTCKIRYMMSINVKICTIKFEIILLESLLKWL